MHVWYKSLATGLMLIAAKGVFAYTCETVTRDVKIEPLEIATQRDISVGTLLKQVVSDVVTPFKCLNTKPSLTWQEFGIKAFGAYDRSLDGRRVYKTNLKGIGYAVGMRPTSNCPNETWVTEANNQNMNCHINGAFSTPVSARVLINFYKTEPIVDTGMLYSLQVASFILKNNQTSWHSPESAISVNQFQVRVKSCRVDKAAIMVDMGEVAAGAFNGPGTSPPSNRTKAFDIPLTCERGTSITLRLDGTAHDADQGMLALSAGTSSASGVAIQLLKGAKPVALGKSIWQMAVGEPGSYTIPFKARYVQTSNNIKAGAANASATFTLTYP